MALHIENHKIDGEEKYLLVTDKGAILATFSNSESVEIYKQQVSLTWIFAHEVGRTGI